MEEGNEELKKASEELKKNQQECSDLASECQEINNLAEQMSNLADGQLPTSGQESSTGNGNEVTEKSELITNCDGVNNEQTTCISAEDMNVAELKVKIVCLEKNNVALRMELKCAELQVAAKEKIDAKKTRLIELLDHKLAAVEKKNLHLIEMMEQMVKDKDSHSKRLIDATKNMEELGKKLAASERVKREMATMNKELMSMLENVEGKGTKIAQLAKEKVLKYKEENIKLQQQLDQKNVGGTEVSSSDTPGEVSEAGVESSADNDALLSCGVAEMLRRQLADGLTTALKQDQDHSVEKLTNVLKTALEQCFELEKAQQELRSSVTASLNAHAASMQSRLVELEKQKSEQIAEKDKQMATLNEELTRLKAAIGQLVGFGGGMPAPAPAPPPSE